MKTQKKSPKAHEKEVISQGREAFIKQLPITANPYITGTHDSNLWDTGWLENQREHSKQPNSNN